MKRLLSATAVALLVSATAALACPKDGEVVQVVDKGAKNYDCCPKALSKAVAAAMQDMPKITYKVGDFETCCAETAKAKAQHGIKMVYVVGDKTFDREFDALANLTEQLEARMQDMQTLQFAAGGKTFHCPVSAKAACHNGEKVKYQVAGMKFETREKAEEALEQIKLVLTTKTASAKTKSGCNKPCPLEAKQAHAVAASEKKSDCDKAKSATTTTASAKTKPCCDKDKKAKTVAASDSKSDCPHAAKQAQAVAASDKSDCPHAAKATTVTASNDKPCSGEKACCVEKAQQRLATVQDQIRLVVETAAKVALSGGSSA